MESKKQIRLSLKNLVKKCRKFGEACLLALSLSSLPFTTKQMHLLRSLTSSLGNVVVVAGLLPPKLLSPLGGKQSSAKLCKRVSRLTYSLSNWVRLVQPVPRICLRCSRKMSGSRKQSSGGSGADESSSRSSWPPENK